MEAFFRPASLYLFCQTMRAGVRAQSHDITQVNMSEVCVLRRSADLSCVWRVACQSCRAAESTDYTTASSSRPLYI